MVCLLQLVYFSRRFRSLLAGPVEIDEVYIIAGLKGRAGGLELVLQPTFPQPVGRAGGD